MEEQKKEIVYVPPKELKKMSARVKLPLTAEDVEWLLAMHISPE